MEILKNILIIVLTACLFMACITIFSQDEMIHGEIPYKHVCAEGTEWVNVGGKNIMPMCKSGDVYVKQTPYYLTGYIK